MKQFLNVSLNENILSILIQIGQREQFNFIFQSDLAAAECRVSALNAEHDTVMSRAEKAESSLSMLKSDLEKLTSAKKQETELLARKVYFNIRHLIKFIFSHVNS